MYNVLEGGTANGHFDWCIPTRGVADALCEVLYSTIETCLVTIT